MLSQIPELEKQFTAFAQDTVEGEILSDRERALAALAVVFTLEDTQAVKESIIEAKQAGVTNKEIGYVNALVIALRGKKIARLGVVGANSTPLRVVQSKCCE